MSQNRHDEKYMPRGEAIVATIVFSALLSVPAILVSSGIVRGHYRGLRDPDVWWHLRTAEWMITHEAWPQTDPFSHNTTGTEWRAYSWLFELPLFGSYQAFGIEGIVLFTSVLWTLTTAAFFVVIRQCQVGLLLSGAMTLLAVVGTAPLATPRPWHLTMFFTVVELGILLAASRSNRPRLLLWLVPLFWIWANTHIQFALGLVVLGIALLESLLARVLPARFVTDESRAISPQWNVLVLLVCMTATLVNPYGWRLYEVIILYMGQSELSDVIMEFRAMGFRNASEWVVLGVTITTAFMIGRMGRVRLLLPLLFLTATYFSFNGCRDMWFVLLVGLITVAYLRPTNKSQPQAAALPKPAIGGVAAIVSVSLCALVLQLDEAALKDNVAAHFPEDAVSVVRQRGYEGPLFNTFGWGGFLIYHLPEYPVSIDGRTNVHGTERCVRNFRTMRGKPSWKKDPELAEAGVAIIPRELPLTSLMRHHERFKVVHEDEVAVVFIAKDQ